MTTRSVPQRKGRRVDRHVGRLMVGFTLIELLLVLALASIITGAAFIVIADTVKTDARATSLRIIAQALNRAQLASWSMRNDSRWGVAVSSASATVFKGGSFGGRDSEYDEVLEFATPVDISGDAEFVFGKGTGLPDASGTVSVTFDDISHHVIVSEQGAISYVIP